MPHQIEVSGGVMLLKIDPNADMTPVNEVMSEVQDSWVEEIKQMAKNLRVSEGVAGDIWYLRTRSRWTQDLENQLIAADQAGNPIDSGAVLSGEWPPDRVSPLTNINKEL